MRWSTQSTKDYNLSCSLQSPPPPPIIPKSIKSNLGLYTVVEVPMFGLITILGQVRIRVQSETNALAGK